MHYDCCAHHKKRFGCTEGSTVTGGTITEGGFPLFPLDTADTIVQQTGQAQAYNLTFDVEGSVPGQMFFDPKPEIRVLDQTAGALL